MLVGVVQESLMKVSLTPELERFVQERIASGRYRSESEVLEAALSLLREREEREREREAKLAALRADIDEGIASLDRGEGIPGDEAFARLRARRPL